MEKEKKRKIKVPHPFVLICILIIICTILTYIVPAGTYDRYYDEEVGAELVDPDSFHYIENTPVDPFEMVQAIPTGMAEVGWIIFLVFIIGGAFGIINKTGAIEAGLGASINVFKKQSILLIGGLMTVFSLGGATFAMAESTLIFLPMCVMLTKAMGYDAVVGMAVINIGAVIGFTGGWMNMYTVGVAQGIAGLELFSGMGYRILCHVVLLIIAIFYVVMYAKRIKKDPTRSLMTGVPEIEETKFDMENIPEFTKRRKIILIWCLVCFIVLIYGITAGWSTSTEVSALFLVMGIGAGFIYGLKSGDIANAFVEGAKSIAFGALLIGLCRAMVVILTNGQIIDTILHGMASLFDGLPSIIAAGLMVPIQLLVNFLINSGSGQAAATMPIMAPLADILGVSRQTAVLAFQFGDGLSNSLWPTSGILMASLGIAGIPYEKWLKFVGKLMLYLYIACTILVMIAYAINYQ